MAKREYIQANKQWLEAKAKEEGVKALPKGIYYKILSEGRSSSARYRRDARIKRVRSQLFAVLSQLIIQVEPLTASSSTAAVAVCLWHADSVTSSKAGLSPCSRCTSATSGRFTSLQRWAKVENMKGVMDTNWNPRTREVTVIYDANKTSARNIKHFMA